MQKCPFKQETILIKRKNTHLSGKNRVYDFASQWSRNPNNYLKYKNVLEASANLFVFKSFYKFSDKVLLRK